MAYLDSDNITDDIFDMIAYVETNNHVALDEIEGIFYANVIHCKEVNILPLIIMRSQKIR